MNRRSFLAALAAPLVVKSNVGLTMSTAPLTVSDIEYAYQRAMYGNITRYTWNALSPAMKRKLKYHAPRP